jgi:hypothetical protein
MRLPLRRRGRSPSRRGLRLRPASSRGCPGRPAGQPLVSGADLPPRHAVGAGRQGTNDRSSRSIRPLSPHGAGRRMALRGWLPPAGRCFRAATRRSAHGSTATRGRARRGGGAGGRRRPGLGGRGLRYGPDRTSTGAGRGAAGEVRSPRGRHRLFLRRRLGPRQPAGGPARPRRLTRGGSGLPALPFGGVPRRSARGGVPGQQRGGRGLLRRPRPATAAGARPSGPLLPARAGLQSRGSRPRVDPLSGRVPGAVAGGA